MAKSRKPKAETAKVSGLLDALKFLSLVTKDVGAPCVTHIYLKQNWAMAFNGVLSAGHKITETIEACPHNKLMIEALSKCEQEFTIAQDGARLAIKSGKFKAFVPCLDQSLLQIYAPDEPIAVINDTLKVALEAVSVLANEQAQNILMSSILLNGTSVIATNRVMIFEYWHGINMPSNLAIPKTVVQALVKITKKLTGFGFSDNSVTFWFEDQSWLKAQRYAEPYSHPDIALLLNKSSNQYPLPADFWTALDAVAPFSEKGLVWCDTGTMRSHAETGVGASFDVVGLPRGPIFLAKQLRLIQPFAETVDFFAPGPYEGTTMLMFYGKSMRGVIAGREE